MNLYLTSEDHKFFRCMKKTILSFQTCQIFWYKYQGPHILHEGSINFIRLCNIIPKSWGLSPKTCSKAISHSEVRLQRFDSSPLCNISRQIHCTVSARTKNAHGLILRLFVFYCVKSPYLKFRPNPISNYNAPSQFLELSSCCTDVALGRNGQL